LNLKIIPLFLLSLNKIDILSRNYYFLYNAREIGLSVKYKQRIFIYDRREIILLSLIAAMATLFAFTLGIHLVHHGSPSFEKASLMESSPVKALPDQLPKNHEFVEQNKIAWQALEETLSQELHDEVSRNGVKLDSPHAVNLPEKTKAETKSKRKPSSVDEQIQQVNYTLQIGSFSSMIEAKAHMSKFEQAGLSPFLREVILNGKGKWYRIYVGDYSTPSEAEQAGQKYRSEHILKNFIVANLSE
jgi:hypothetical protein